MVYGGRRAYVVPGTRKRVSKLPVLCNRCFESPIQNDVTHRNHNHKVYPITYQIGRKVDPNNTSEGRPTPTRRISQYKFIMERRVIGCDNIPHQHYWRQIKIASNYGSISTYDQYAGAVYKMTADARKRLYYKR